MNEIIAALEAMVRRIVDEQITKALTAEVVARTLTDGLNEKIETMVEAEVKNFDFSEIIGRALRDYDDRITELTERAVENYDYKDIVADIVGNMDFTVRVN